jgi:cell division septal protein FtsQ
MWGSRKSETTRRRSRAGNRRAGATLEVAARARGRSKIPAKFWLKAILVPAAILAVLGGLAIGVLSLGRALFSRNDAFSIRQLVVDTDDPVALSYLEGKRDIRKGQNLFAFDIGDVRREFLRHAPNYRAIKLTRILPGTLTISVTPRDPLVLIGRRGGFAVDADGCVFGQRNAPDALPLIVGYQGAFLKPGDRVQGLASDAVRLLDTWLNTDVEREMIVRTVDVRGGHRGAKDALRVVLDGDTTVDFAWKRGRTRGAASVDDLRARILFLRAMVRQARDEGRRLKDVDLTLDDYRQRNSAKYW